MKAAWYHKWLVHRRLRPEEAGGRLHHHLTGAADYPLHPKLANSAAPERVCSRYGSYLCPRPTPRAARPIPPTREPPPPSVEPGYGCSRALSNPNFVIPEPVVPSDDA